MGSDDSSDHWPRPSSRKERVDEGPKVFNSGIVGPAGWGRGRGKKVLARKLFATLDDGVGEQHLNPSISQKTSKFYVNSPSVDTSAASTSHGASEDGDTVGVVNKNEDYSGETLTSPSKSQKTAATSETTARANIMSPLKASIITRRSGQLNFKSPMSPEPRLPIRPTTPSSGRSVAAEFRDKVRKRVNEDKTCDIPEDVDVFERFENIHERIEKVVREIDELAEKVYGTKSDV